MGLVFEYRPTSGSAVSTSSSALGTVVMATDYDVLDLAFASKQQMESYEFAVSTVPFQGVLHPVECEPRKSVLSRLYVRDGPVSGSDLRFNDFGNFYIATQGMQSAYAVGELWASYDVKLLKPYIQPAFPLGNQAYYTHITELPVGTATAAHPLGTTGGTTFANSALPGVLVSSTAPTTSFVLSNIGSYYVDAIWYTASGNIAASPTLTLGTNLANSPALLANGASASSSLYSSDGTTSHAVRMITCTASGTGANNTVVITGLTSMTAAHCDIFFFQLQY
jgi:hypothetical protein